MITVTKVRQLRAVIERGVQALNLEPKDASEIPELYPMLKQTGALVPYRTIIRWTDGSLYMAAQDLWDLESNDPAHLPGGWVKLMYRDGIRIIPETMTTANLFMKDEIGWWQDQLYKSKIDYNSWNPSAYPDGWELVG